MVFNTQAQEMEQEVQAPATMISKENNDFVMNTSKRNFNLELGFVAQNFDLESAIGNEKTEFDGRGINIGISKIFTLSPFLTTSTGLKGFANILDEDQNQDFSEPAADYSNLELNIVQRLSLNLDVGNGNSLRPFVEVAAGVGTYKTSLETTRTFNSVTTRTDLSADINYRSFGGALGLQYVINNTVMPFIRYDYRTATFSNEIEFDGIDDGQQVNRTVTVDGLNDVDITISSLVIGVGFLF